MAARRTTIAIIFTLVILRSCGNRDRLVREQGILKIKITRNYHKIPGEAAMTSLTITNQDSIRQIIEMVNSATPEIVKFMPEDKMEIVYPDTIIEVGSRGKVMNINGRTYRAEVEIRGLYR